MVSNESSVPFRYELRDLARLKADEFRGSSSLAVVSISEKELLCTSDASCLISCAVLMVTKHIFKVPKAQNPCKANKLFSKFVTKIQHTLKFNEDVTRKMRKQRGLRTIFGQSLLGSSFNFMANSSA